MSSYAPLAHSYRSNVTQPLSQDDYTSSSQGTEWDAVPGASYLDNFYDESASGSVPMRTMRARAPQDYFSDVGEDSGKSIDGVDLDTHTFAQLGGLSSEPRNGNTARGTQPMFSDRSRAAPSNLEALAAIKKRPSRACRLGTAGALAVLVGAAIGLGVYFGKVRPDAAAAARGTGEDVVSQPTSTRPDITTPIETTPPAPVATGSAGILRNGVYSVTQIKESDACAAVGLVCEESIADTWTFSTVGSRYNVLIASRQSTFSSGALTASNELSFGVGATDVLEANNCSYTVGWGYALSLTASSFAGLSIIQHALDSSCADSSGTQIPVGTTCDCRYDLTGK